MRHKKLCDFRRMNKTQKVVIHVSAFFYQQFYNFRLTGRRCHMKWGKSPIRSPAELLTYSFINVYADIYQCSYGFYIAVTDCCMKGGQGVLRNRQQDYFYWLDLPGYVLPEHRRGTCDRQDKNGKEYKDAFHGRIRI